MTDHAPVCVCDSCWPEAFARAVASGLRARVEASFEVAKPEAPPRPRTKIVIREVVRWRARRPRPRVDQVPTPAPEVVQAKAEPPLVVAPEVDHAPAPEPVTRPRRVGRPRKVAAPDRDPKPDNIAQPAGEPERACRVCGDHAPTAWAQRDLCAAAACVSAAARAGADRTKTARMPARAGKAKRRAAIARRAGRIEQQIAAAERAAATDHDDEELEPRLERIPEVADA